VGGGLPPLPTGDRPLSGIRVLDLSRLLPGGLADGRLQRLEDGSGPLFRRRYRVRIEGSRLTPEQLMAEMLREPNRAAPIEVAVFRKTRGGEGPLAVGDEFVVRMPGPWDGPVLVVDRTPTSFRFATLEGHLEAGQIEFRTSAGGGDAVCFEIESWARSGDRLSGLLFDRAVQNGWVLERVKVDGIYVGPRMAQAAAPHDLDVQVTTRERDAKGFKPLPLRWRIEATFGTMTNRYRRLTRNLEQHAKSAEDAFELAHFRRVLRVYARDVHSIA
jgi:transposase